MFFVVLFCFFVVVVFVFISLNRLKSPGFNQSHQLAGHPAGLVAPRLAETVPFLLFGVGLQESPTCPDGHQSRGQAASDRLHSSACR